MTDYGDEILGADYFYPRASLIWTNSSRENKRSDSVEFCGITGIGYVITEIRSPIPHINLNDMLIEVACRIWDIETQGMHAEVQDVNWCYSEDIIPAGVLERLSQICSI